MGILSYAASVSAIKALLFAKFPQPGKVNTRLVPPLSHDEAAGLHQAAILATVELLAEHLHLETILVGTPDARLGDFGAIAGVSALWAQGEGDLGERLTRAVDRAFAEGAGGVMLFGADSPTVAASVLRDAVSLVASGATVLGPCDDGGYYVLGLPRACPVLFEGIAWGSDEVANQTRLRAKQAGLLWHELPTWYDLDRPDDLRRAAGDLVDEGETGGSARRALRSLIESLIAR